MDEAPPENSLAIATVFRIADVGILIYWVLEIFKISKSRSCNRRMLPIKTKHSKYYYYRVMKTLTKVFTKRLPKNHSPNQSVIVK